jgi:hypothetical protein
MGKGQVGMTMATQLTSECHLITMLYALHNYCWILLESLLN